MKVNMCMQRGCKLSTHALGLFATCIPQYLADTLILYFCVTGFLLDKKIGVNQPKRLENAKILVSNTSMDTDKVKVCGNRKTIW